MPIAVREEVARQLELVQAAEVIQPSTSPWASPVVMVRKKDGTHRFCVDYRRLNAVTKTDTYPLPRIDDLLDQLGHCQYFSTLDLASGYWQIRMSPESREKTAFVTSQGFRHVARISARGFPKSHGNKGAGMASMGVRRACACYIAVRK